MADPAPIFLIGFMASGKSTVGRLLAESMGREFHDLDEVVEARAGLSVADIFQSEGEAGFRKREREALRALSEQPGVVVATGGGAPFYSDNLDRMRRSGLVIGLRASLEHILKRVADPASRPLLQGPEGVKARAQGLLAEREAVYESAEVVVDTDGAPPETLAERCRAQAEARLGSVRVCLSRDAYAVHLAPLSRAGELANQLFDGRTAAVITDENVARAGHARRVRESLEEKDIDVVEVVLPPGEAHKRLATVESILDACVSGGLDRRSFLMAVGGGVVGDMVGFAASMLFRGVPCAQVPTTLLAMVDSAIGGKTGVDLRSGKNLAGAFWQPRFVLADVTTLETLPERERRAAMGEILKYGLLFDPELFGALEGDGDAMSEADMIQRCARHKARVVAEDERETSGTRALLNLGHTVGHAIEAASGMGTGQDALLHGEAIALGLIASARVSARVRLCDAGLEDRVASAVRRQGLPADLDPWVRAEVLAYIGVDKKRAGGRIGFVGLEDVGRPRRVELAPEEIARILELPRSKWYDLPGR